MPALPPFFTSRQKTRWNKDSGGAVAEPASLRIALLRTPAATIRLGLGEELEDLRPFDAREFVDGLFSEAEDSCQAASGTYAA